MPYNKPLTNLACSGRTGEYWPSVVAVRTERKQGITHQIGSELVEFFVVSIAVFSVHISEAFESLQIPPPPPPPFNRYKVAIHLELGYCIFFSSWSINIIICKQRSGPGDYIFTQCKGFYFVDKTRKNWEFAVAWEYAYLYQHSDLSPIYSKLTWIPR